MKLVEHVSQYYVQCDPNEHAIVDLCRQKSEKIIFYIKMINSSQTKFVAMMLVLRF